MYFEYLRNDYLALALFIFALHHFFFDFMFHFTYCTLKGYLCPNHINKLWNFCGRTFGLRVSGRERENTTTNNNTDNNLLMDLLFFNSICVLTSRVSGWCVICVSLCMYIVHCRISVDVCARVLDWPHQFDMNIEHGHIDCFHFSFPFSRSLFLFRRVCFNCDYFLCNFAQMYWRILFPIIICLGLFFIKPIVVVILHW